MGKQSQIPVAEEELLLKPLDTSAGFPVRPGFYDRNGATALNGAVNFTVHSHGATSCELLLYHREEQEPYARIPFPEKYRIGHVFSMIVFGLDIGDFEYAYCLDGPWDPAKGLLFDRNRPLLDPYAKAVTGQSVWGEQRRRDGLFRARVVKNNFDWGNEPPVHHAMQDLIIYELHVRGFTKHPSSGVAHPGTFAGLKEKIPYLQELGVNAVELMPVFEFDETMDAREVDGQKLFNYWGYSTVSFFAPNTSYAAANEYNREGTELKELIRALADAGIEVILDVVFNHTAEGNENGPFISFKGFDNNIYYMLTPDGRYYNFSGCGNTVNCNHPLVQEMIVECLRYWVTDYRVSGFRFDLASILGRSEDGSPQPNAPLLKRLAFDPILGNTKLIAEAWDAGGLYQVGTFPAWNRWAEWNGKYRDTMRDFLKGDYWEAPEAARRLIGSPDLYRKNYNGYHSSVNFLTCHDGFCLRDLYSYQTKHNEANGWDNTDGADDNRSWNCGVEGPTDDPKVNALRLRLMKNAAVTLLMSRGTPMFLAGDEFGNTQKGNNNAYCQDSDISWLDWSELPRWQPLYDCFRQAIALRKAHPAIRGDLKPAFPGFPAVSVHTEVPWPREITADTKVLTVLYAGMDETAEECREDLVCFVMNVYWENRTVCLPGLPFGYGWRCALYTGDNEQPAAEADDAFRMEARSVAVFEGMMRRQADENNK